MLKLWRKLQDKWYDELSEEYWSESRHYKDHFSLSVTVLARIFGGGLFYWVWWKLRSKLRYGR